MHKNVGKELSDKNILKSKDKQKKPKRIEWLNVHSKGFIVQSLNNNYKNQNIKIKKPNKKIKNAKNIVPIKLTNSISKKGIKSNISNSNYSSKKTNFTFIIDDEEDFYNKNKPLISSLNNLNSRNNNKIEKLKKEIIKTDKKIKNINKEEKKLYKNNSVKYISYIKQDKIGVKIMENKKNKQYNHKSIKMNAKISLKKDINSPLLNYLEKANKNLNQSYFNSINNKNKNKKYADENSNIRNPNKNQKENNNRENLDKSFDKNSDKNEMNKGKRKKIRYSKSIKEIKINNINLIEIHKYMIEGRKFKSRKNNYNYMFNNSYKEEMGDYSYDYEEDKDKLIMSERKNIISFSEICSSTNNYMTNKKEFNKFFGESMKNKQNTIKFNLLKSSQF